MMQPRQPARIRRIHRAPMLKQQPHHRHAPDRGRSVQGELLPFIFYPGGGAAAGEEFARGREVVF